MILPLYLPGESLYNIGAGFGVLSVEGKGFLGMIYNYKTKGVCARAIELEIDEDGVIEEVNFTGGCDGNLKGMSALVRGRRASEVIGLLEGMPCGTKRTSCPDQLANALREILEGHSGDLDTPQDD